MSINLLNSFIKFPPAGGGDTDLETEASVLLETEANVQLETEDA